MEYKYEDVEKIVNFSTWSDKKKIDELFRIDCYMYTNLGIDSAKKEIEEVRKKSKYIYRVINKIDKVLGKELMYNIDS